MGFSEHSKKSKLVLISRIENDWKWEEIEFNIPYQSELTAILVEDILMNDSCSLPSYEESVKLHLPYLDSILELINSNTQNKFDLSQYQKNIELNLINEISEKIFIYLRT